MRNSKNRLHMNETDFVSSSQAVYLGSFISSCPVPFFCSPKIFSFFNKSIVEISVSHGNGRIKFFDVNVSPVSNNNDDFEEMLEFGGDFNSECFECKHFQSIVVIYNHLKMQIMKLYSASVEELSIFFGIRSRDSIEEIHLLSVSQCFIKKPKIYPEIAHIPDALDIISHFVLLFGFIDYPESKCFGSCHCRFVPKISASLGSILRYKLYEVFFDCNIKLIHDHIKVIMSDMKPMALRKSIMLCSSCYHDWQVYESSLVNPGIGNEEFYSQKRQNKSEYGIYSNKKTFSNVAKSMISSTTLQISGTSNIFSNTKALRHSLNSTKKRPKSEIMAESIYGQPPYTLNIKKK